MFQLLLTKSKFMTTINKSKNVFISHQSGDDEHIQKLKDLLLSKGYQLKNSSADSTRPNQATNEEYIKRLLRLRMQWAGTVIVLIGPETRKSHWVDWEIEIANKKGKKIVGVFINGASDSDVPDNFEKYGDELVGWTSEKIIQAIESEVGEWENPEGKPRKSHWEPVNSNC